jgi:hypothetical protein
MKKIPRTFLLVMVALLATAGIARAAVANYQTHLSGDNEVPPAGIVIETNAQGQAIFQLSPDGSELSYKLNVANIENVFMAHIHIGVPGTNGPIAVWLYPSTAVGPGPLGQGRIQGRIAEGTITSADLVNQSATGVTTLAQLIAAMEAGRAYVNVHTNDGVAPVNTGPGDFPGGEIRGPLDGHGH